MARGPCLQRPRRERGVRARGTGADGVSGRTLITGGAGFIGTNLADRILTSGRRVLILDDLSRGGTEENLRWLCERHGSAVDVEVADIRKRAAVRRCIRSVESVFHLA